MPIPALPADSAEHSCDCRSRAQFVAILGATVLAALTPAECPGAVAQPRSTLQDVCTHEFLQGRSPESVTIQDIPNLNPAVSRAVTTHHGVAYVAAGQFGDGAPEYCLVTGSVVTNPASGKTANFGAALPAHDGWSRRFLMQGCGGTCGDVFNNGPPAATLIARGYAVWATDDGHVDLGYDVNGRPVSVDSRWAVKAPGELHADAVVDYAYRAVQMTVRTGKEITRRFYSNTPVARAYFIGCSGGGREALQEATRYPEDFDGIVAGAPFLDPAAAVIAGLSSQIAQFHEPGAALPAESFDIVSTAIMRKCDPVDGVTDGLIQNPAACDFDPRYDIPRCIADSRGPSCLTGPQTRALSSMFNAVRDDGGRLVAPGYSISSISARGTAEGMGNWVAFPRKPVDTTGPFPFGPAPERDGMFNAWTLADGMLRNFTYFGRSEYNSLSTPGIRIRRTGLDGDVEHRAEIPAAIAQRIDRSLAALSVGNPYALAGFITQGRKIILWHGYADAMLTPFVTVRYYRDLAALYGGYQRLQRNVRLFMAPDVDHCGWGGSGPNAFQTLYHGIGGEWPPPRMDADHDLLMALEAWVERGVEPRRIIAARYQDDDFTKPVVRTMPLCPFPAMAKYDGRGDVNQASSWSCPEGDERMLESGRFGTAGGLR